MNDPDILWKFQILLCTVVQIYYERSRFYYERSRYIMKVPDFPLKNRVVLWIIKILLWRRVKIFMITGRDFHDGRSRFLSWQLEIFMMVPGQDFSWRQLDIFMMTGKDFYDSRLRFSCWQVDIFMMAGRNFYNEKSKLLWGQVEIFIMTGWDFSFRS